MTIDAREERRRNVKALAIAGAILVLVAAFAYRPATVIGVEGDALAHSVGGGNLLGPSKCIEVADSRWRCQIIHGSDGSTAMIETRAFGCWELIRKESTGEHGVRLERSGCINAIDLVSPF